MAVADLIMPKLGESIIEATVLKWHKKVGDKVNQDETVLDIATDKVDSEVPSTAAGTLIEILFKQDDVVPVGAVIARIETEGGAATVSTPQAATQQQPQDEAGKQAAAEVPYVPTNNTSISNSAANGANNNGFFSPLVLNIARSEAISMAELENIKGTGAEGRVSKKDILAFVENRKSGGQTSQMISQQPTVDSPQTVTQTQSQQVSQPTNQPVNQPTEQPKNYGDNVEIIEMDRMRKLIAKHMVDSKHTSPHVTSFVEADVTNMVMWRNNVKNKFEKQEGTKITFTPLFMECIARVIKRYPMINSSLDGNNIIVRKDINIGMATALPTGNLIVPVIRNTDHLNLVGLAKAVNNMADSARNNKLRPDDTQGGTFTLTNVGTFGSLMGTPIINQPQVAILAVGAIKKRPVVIETSHGDTIGIRHMMYLSMSYDHRIVDGSLGAQFLTEVAKEFERWDVNRAI